MTDQMADFADAMAKDLAKAALIADQNDRFRAAPGSDPALPGILMITSGLQSLRSHAVGKIVEIVRSFDSFTEANDPHGWRDFGAFDFQSFRIFWKIDLYDHALQGGSPCPEDPAQTKRVLTVMLAEEY